MQLLVNPATAVRVLRYCAWCNSFVGFVPGEGSQILPHVCEIDTSTICNSCREHLESQFLPPVVGLAVCGE